MFSQWLMTKVRFAKDSRANSNFQVRLKSAVSAEFPDVDFFCFQEVWDRLFAGILISKLRKKYPHFIMDVSQQSLKTQLCLGSKHIFNLFESYFCVLLSYTMAHWVLV